MKRFSFLPVLLAIGIMAGTAHGYVDKRYQWWQQREGKLSAEIAALEKSGRVDSSVIGFMKEEREKVRGIIAIFERELANDATLSHDTRSFSAAEVRERSDAVAGLVFRIATLDMLLNEKSAADFNDEVRALIAGDVAGLLGARFGEAGADEASCMLQEELSPTELRIAATEILFVSVMKNREQARAKTADAVFEAAAKSICAPGYTSTEPQVRVKILETALGWYDSHPVQREFTPRAADLRATGWWARYSAGIAAELKACERIAAKLGGGDLSIKRLRWLARNPGEMDAVLFDKMRDAIPAPAHQDAEPPAKGGPGLLVIPRPVNANTALDEMDRLRKRLTPYINGTETNAFYQRVSAKLDMIIGFHAGEANRVFAREEERLRAAREKNEGPFANEQELRAAREHHDAMLATMREYGSRCVAFLQWLSGTKTGNGEELVALHKLQVDRDREYLDMVRELLDACAPVAGYENERLNRLYSLALRSTGSINALMSLPAYERTHLHLLAGNQVKQLRESKAALANTLVDFKQEVRALYTRYAGERKSQAQRLRAGHDRLKEMIAQHEVTLLWQGIERCAAVYGGFAHTAEALARYADAYDRLEKDARSGDASEGLGKALQAGSLLRTIDGIDRGRIDTERASREYLRGEGQAAIARLASLLQFYKYNGVIIQDRPSQEELEEKKQALAARVSIGIGAWTMNEYNLDSIDHKAVQTLAVLRNRKTIEDRAHASRSEAPSELSLAADDLTLTFQVPAGWETGKPGEVDGVKGIISRFSDPLASSTVEVMREPLENRTLKDVTEARVRAAGGIMVKNRWGVRGGGNYFWVLSRDRESNVFETYAVECNGRAVVVQSKTPKEKYGITRAKVEAFFQSLHY